MFKWDGQDSTSDIFEYACGLGPRDTTRNAIVVKLSRLEAEAMKNRFCSRFPSVVLPEVTDKQAAEAVAICDDVAGRLEEVLPEGRWFVKTNRHSPKDAPLDYPTEEDIRLFEKEFKEFDIPCFDCSDPDSVDYIDFGPVFAAFCKSRLQSLVVTSGSQAMELLTRSMRIFNDIDLQLGLQTSEEEFDFYIAFSPFDDNMASHPLQEFRCYVSNRELRAICLYQHLHACLFTEEESVTVAEVIAKKVYEDVIPHLGDGVVDVAVDVCVTRLGDVLEAKIVEYNPLGPGTVWGLVDWSSDSKWLLGRSPPPPPCLTTNSAGGESRTAVISSTDHPPFLLLTTLKHPLGMMMGGLAHIPATIMHSAFTTWGLDQIEPRSRRECEEVKEGWCVVL